MRYYIFAKKNWLADKLDWYDPVITRKNIYTTEEFESALYKYNEEMDQKKSDETIFLVADFGTSKSTKYFDITFINKEQNYFPFFVIRCSDDHEFNYEETFNMKDVRILLMQSGIHQYFFDPAKAFDRYDYYRRYRIDGGLALEYKDEDNQIHTIPLSTIKGIIFGEDNKYIRRLGFESKPGHHLVGPFWVKDKEAKEQVEA